MKIPNVAVTILLAASSQDYAGVLAGGVRQRQLSHLHAKLRDDLNDQDIMAYSAINAGDQDQDTVIQEGGAFEEALEEKEPALRTARRPRQQNRRNAAAVRRPAADAGSSTSEELLSSIKALAQSNMGQQQALGSLASTQASSYN